MKRLLNADCVSRAARSAAFSVIRFYLAFLAIFTSREVVCCNCRIVRYPSTLYYTNVRPAKHDLPVEPSYPATMTFPSSGDVSPTTITSPTATWRRSSLPGSSSNAGLQNTSKTRRRTVAGFAVCLVLFLWVTSSSYRARHSAGYTSWRTALQQKYGAVSGSAESSGPARLVKLSMLYGNNTELLERALETQQKHSDQWGLEMRVMREDIQMEAFNKPSYLLSTIINELAKPHEQRADWIM